MAQNYTIDCFAASQVGLTSLQNMENNFECLRTLFSGSSAPANSTGGVPWFDTGNKILKLRNSTNGAWLGVHYSSTAARWWVYANTAGDGWIVDSSVTDRVIAIKGGSAAYNVAGGNVGGSWTFSGHTISTASTAHIHQWYSYSAAPYSYDSTGNAVALVFAATTQSPGISGDHVGDNSLTAALYTDRSGGNHTHTLSHDATWRPAATVGTLQYLSL